MESPSPVKHSVMHPASWQRRRSGFSRVDRQYGKWGYILAWLVGIPVPILLLVYFVRGCS